MRRPAPASPRARTSTPHKQDLNKIIDFRLRVALTILGLLASTGAAAIDVNVVGLFPGKAVVQIDGGTLQTLSVGQRTAQGVVLVSVDREQATFEIEGRRMTLGLGHARMKPGASSSESVKLIADERGHFVVDGQVNGMPMRFAIDTGATYISLPASEARRLGVEYHNGRKAMMLTANGNVPAFRVKLDTVRIGDITVNSVDAVVMESGSLPVALLGMSFLNRMDIRREGEIMTLTKRY